MSLNKEEMIETYRSTGMTYSSYNAAEGASWNAEAVGREKARQEFYKARDALKKAGIERPNFDFLISSSEL